MYIDFEQFFWHVSLLLLCAGTTPETTEATRTKLTVLKISEEQPFEETTAGLVMLQEFHENPKEARDRILSSEFA